MFKLLKHNKKIKARLGVLATLHGEIKTPFFMPIATRGAVKGISSQELEELGAEIILSNTYHLFLRPGEKIVKSAKYITPPSLPLHKGRGLHAFMNWSGPILTDSGGFQVFSLAKSRKISERGVEFRSDLDGKKYLLTPEKSIEVQLSLESDIIMVLDECVPYPVNREYVKKSVELTTRWAQRCRKYFDAKNPKSQITNYKSRFYRVPTKSRILDKVGRLSTKSEQIPNSKFQITPPNLPLHKGRKEGLLFGIVQGGIYKDLRKKSAEDLIKLNFDGYAIGGLAVGEPREKMWEIVKFLCGILPKNKPRYLMGVGMPEDIVRAVNLGCDMFDCVIPTRNARHGYIFKSEIRNPKLETNSKSARLTGGSKIPNPNFYEIIRINNSKYKNKFQSIDKNCQCFTCQNYTLAYLHHLFKNNDFLGQRLATIHNIKFYLELMENLRE